jgi:hypothetical protein
VLSRDLPKDLLGAVGLTDEIRARAARSSCRHR